MMEASERPNEKKIKWTPEMEKQLFYAQTVCGTNWDLMQQSYFPEIPAYSLKNKYYKECRNLQSFPEQPTFQNYNFTDKQVAVQEVLKYPFEAKRQLIPEMTAVLEDTRSASQSLMWKNDDLDSEDIDFIGLDIFL